MAENFRRSATLTRHAACLQIDSSRVVEFPTDWAESLRRVPLRDVKVSLPNNDKQEIDGELVHITFCARLFN